MESIDSKGRSRNMDVVLPCLLDRLTNRYPRAKKDSERFRYITLSQYRDNVLRDLCWLLNSASHLAINEIDEDLVYARNSVLTYGISSLTGLEANTANAERIQNEIKNAILMFEPRIMPDTLEVIMIGKQSSSNSDSVIVYEIEGELWSLPFKENIYLKTEIDFQTGTCSIIRKDTTKEKS